MSSYGARAARRSGGRVNQILRLTINDGERSTGKFQRAEQAPACCIDYVDCCVHAVIGLVHEAAAADMDTAYLRGPDAYEVTGPPYPVQQVAAPWYPTNASSPATLPIFKGPIAPTPPAWFWTGFYGGVHVGAVAGTANFTDPFGSSIFGDNVTTPGFLAGGQIGFNWQVPNSNFVLGIEADAAG